MAKIPVYLSPSSQSYNECAIGDTEQDHCRLLASEIYRLLSQDPRFVVGICPIVTGSENERLSSAVWYSNEFMKSNGGNISGQQAYHICLHTDAYNKSATGISAFYIGSGKSKELATNIYNALLDAGLGWTKRRLEEWAELYELKNTIASAVLIENNFHDVYTTAKSFHDNINKIAVTYILAIYKTCNLESLPITTTPTTPTIENNTTDTDKAYKQDFIQKCLDLKLLEDKTWLTKYSENIQVWVTCKMLFNLYQILKVQNENLINDVLNQFENVKIDVVKKK